MNPAVSRIIAGILAITPWSGHPAAEAQTPDLAVIRPEVQTGFVNSGWKYDRYSDLPSLDAHTKMPVADLKGPGVIRHIHTTRHQPEELASRGVVLEIWFDDADEPAVQCPLADFFGDGCNGQAMDFSTPFIECAPWSYNSYFPMPFKSRARVFLRNDTGKDLGNYSYVEWEPLDKWDDRLGYFHATYQRKTFQLNKDSDETFFEIEGAGHLLGRQYSVVSEEPIFESLKIIMEGNNEVDIDGQERRLDYLGTEDSFTFSWGFQKTFIGQHAGITMVKHDPPVMLSIYRFHDHQPIRFNKSLRWHINWSQEHGFIAGWENPDPDPAALQGARWAAAVNKGGCWVDYATVYYWFQTVPGGFRHQPLPPVEERAKPFPHPMAKE